MSASVPDAAEGASFEADAVAAVHRPARLSAVGALLAALVAVGLLADPGIYPALLVEAVAVAVLAGSCVLRWRGLRLAGLVGGVVSVGILAAAFGFAFASVGDPAEFVKVFPGMLGAFVLAAGVVPVRGRGSRALVKLGAALAFATVLVVGILPESSSTTLLASGVGTVVAWDLGENAISVGEQLGSDARTWPAELSHAVGSLTVAGVAVVASDVFAGVDAGDLSLTQFGVLLVALVLLAAALHD